MNLYIVDIRKTEFDFDKLFNALPLAEQNKINAYKNKDDKVRSLIGLTLAHRYLNIKEVKYTENGKPFGNCGFFNISHSGDIVVLLSSKNNDVGVDIEHINRDKKKLDEYVFGTKMSQKEFIENWTRLEAFSKCLGTGFGKEYKKYPHKAGVNIYKNKKIYINTLGDDSYVVSVAVLNFQEPLVTINVNIL